MNFFKTTALTAMVAGGVMLAGGAIAQDKTYTIGVSVPTADHGWTGGVDFFAQQAVDRLGKAYPNLKFVLATAPDSTKQAADVEDMLATRNIDALGQLVVSRIQAINGVTRTLTCPVVHL